MYSKHRESVTHYSRRSFYGQHTRIVMVFYYIYLYPYDLENEKFDNTITKN